MWSIKIAVRGSCKRGWQNQLLKEMAAEGGPVFWIRNVCGENREGIFWQSTAAERLQRLKSSPSNSPPLDFSSNDTAFDLLNQTPQQICHGILATFSLSYSGRGAYATAKGEYHGLKLIVYATMMGNSAALSRDDNCETIKRPGLDPTATWAQTRWNTKSSTAHKSSPATSST